MNLMQEIGSKSRVSLAELGSETKMTRITWGGGDRKGSGDIVKVSYGRDSQEKDGCTDFMFFSNSGPEEELFGQSGFSSDPI